MSGYPATNANGDGEAQDVGPEGGGGGGSSGDIFCGATAAIFDNVDDDLEEQRRTYADRALMGGECWNANNHGGGGDNSTSSLSGGFTTITNLIEGAAANGGSGDQGCSPSRSVFQFIEAIDTRSTSIGPSHSLDSQGLGSFESYYNMQRNGPFIPDTQIRQDEILKHQGSCLDDEAADRDAIRDDFCEHAECGNVSSDLSTEGKSSTMSSITQHEFYPKFNGKGKFTNYGKRSLVAVSKINSAIVSSPHEHHHNQQQSSGKEHQAKDDHSPKKSDGGMFSSMRKKNNLVSGSPWYSLSRAQLVPHHRTDSTPPQDSDKQAQHLDSNDQDGHQNKNMEQAPPFDPLDPARIRPPKEVVIAASAPHHNHQHYLEGMPIYPKSQDSPSIISSSSNFSQLFNNDMRERYRKGAFRSHRCSISTKRSIFIVATFLCLIAIISITSVVMSNKSKDQTPNLDENGATVMNGYDLPIREGIPGKCCVGSYDGLDGTDDEDEHKEDKHLDAAEVESGAPSGSVEEEIFLHNASETVPASEVEGTTPATSTPDQTASDNISSSNSEAAASREPTKQPPEPPVESSPGEIYFAQDQITVTEVSPITEMPTQRPTPPPFSLPTDWGLWAIPAPTAQPSPGPTRWPSPQPTNIPTPPPFSLPTDWGLWALPAPTAQPSPGPTRWPSPQPTNLPTLRPVMAAAAPIPTKEPTPEPSRFPSRRPTSRPTERPSTRTPTREPTMKPNTPMPTKRPIPKPVKVNPNTSSVTIKGVDTTINESRPNKNYGPEPYLEVKGSGRVALMKFDISSLKGYSIGQATLVLFSVSDPAHMEEILIRGLSHVNVYALPRAGNWDEDSATWDEDSNVMRGSFRAASFDVKPEQKSKHRHQVDVSVALTTILSGARGEGPAPSSWDERYVTFMLSTDSGIVDFASREWSGGDGEPELVVLLGTSLPTMKPTRKPTRKPTPSPTEEPTPSPSSNPTTPLPTKEPTDEPTKSPAEPPTVEPTYEPTDNPAMNPVTETPSGSPINPTASPTFNPTARPTTTAPTAKPTTRKPTQRPTILFAICPSEYDTLSHYSPGMHFSIIPLLGPAVPGRKEVYECAGNNCNAAGHVPQKLNTEQSGWALVGTCNYVAPVATKDPTSIPSASPSQKPTPIPTTVAPTSEPTLHPTTSQPTTLSPTPLPTSEPTFQPTPLPTPQPSLNPTHEPSPPPTTSQPTEQPTPNPTPNPTDEPTPDPTSDPTVKPTPAPSPDPTSEPTPVPTPEPTNSTPPPTVT